MHGNESGAVTTINFPHERIFSVAADQLHLADYLFGADDWRVRVHLIWRGKPIWISESRLRPLRFASLRPQTGSAGCSHSHQRGLHGQQDLISRVIDETDRSGYTGCTNLKGASWNDCMGEASWGGIAGWGRPLTPPLSPGRWGCLTLPHAHTGRAILPFSWIQAFGTGWGLSDGGGLYIHHTLSKNTLLHEHHDTATLGRGTCQ